MKPDGGSLIGFGSSGLGGASFKAFDPAKNAALRATEGVISADNSRVKVLVIPTNEELMIARGTRAVLADFIAG